MSEKVHCVDCGYLGIRRLTTRDIDEAEDAFRELGAIPTNSADHRTHETSPTCFMGKRTFWKERKPTTSLQDLLRDEFECDQFTQRVPGHSPKEVFDMNLLLKQRELEREWQERQSREQRQWQERQEKHQWLRTSATIIAAILGPILAVWAAWWLATHS